MHSNAVLLAEHEPEHREYLERQLRNDGYAVFGAGWDAQALDMVERVSPDVVIAAERDLCRKIRAGEPGRTWDRNVPLILLTDPSATAIDRVRALESGADDVIERHLYVELLARMRALLRRASLASADVVEVSGITVDRRTRQVRVGAVPLVLSGREYELAAKLASDPKRVFSKAELLRDVWGIRGTNVRTRTLDSHASRLRRKLEDAGAERVVINVWGVGYRLVEP